MQELFELDLLGAVEIPVRHSLRVSAEAVGVLDHVAAVVEVLVDELQHLGRVEGLHVMAHVLVALALHDERAVRAHRVVALQAELVENGLRRLPASAGREHEFVTLIGCREHGLPHGRRDLAVLVQNRAVDVERDEQGAVRAHATGSATSSPPR